ncbi:MAG: type II secretion system protein N [Gammaproteobacteria bacterium]
MKLSRWLILGGVFYVLFALVRLPASVVVNWLAPESATISGVSGSAWTGEASSIRTESIALTEVRWSLKPWKLLLLKASADINAKVPGGALRTEVNNSLFGNSGTANGLRGVVKLEEFNQVLNLPLPLSGNAGVRLDTLKWRDGTVVAAEGEIQLADLTEQSSAMRLGNFSIMFSPTDDDSIKGVFADTEAIFKLSGDMSLNPDRSYSVNAKIEPTNETPNSIGTAVGMFGATRDANGHYVLSSQGSY